MGERETNSDRLERLANNEELDYLERIRILGAFGLYDASLDWETMPKVTEHPEDDQWIVNPKGGES